MDKQITREYIDVYNAISVDAKLEMLDKRPGWSYRGPIKNGGIYISFEAWEKAKYKKSHSAFKSRSSSCLDDYLDIVDTNDILNVKNWKYCAADDLDKLKQIKQDRFKNVYGVAPYKRDLPTHALFITDDIKWLLNASEENVKKADLVIEKINCNAGGDTKRIDIITDYNTYSGSGLSLIHAAMDVYSKTHNLSYEMFRPSISDFKGDVEINNLVLSEPTIELGSDGIYSDIYYKKKLWKYMIFMDKRHLDSFKDILPTFYIYYGKYNLAEGSFHIVGRDYF